MIGNRIALIHISIDARAARPTIIAIGKTANAEFAATLACMRA